MLRLQPARCWIIVLTEVAAVCLLYACGCAGQNNLFNLGSNAHQGNYWHLYTDHEFPDVTEAEIQQFRHDRGGESCLAVARSTQEPDSALYMPRKGPVQDLASGAPRAIYRWEGNITRQMFDQTPTNFNSVCLGCRMTNRYKLLNGQLYARKDRQSLARDEVVEKAEEMLLVAAYLFQLADVDFIMHFDDGMPSGFPTINWSIDRSSAQAGFTMPTYSNWLDALGKIQLQTHAKCLQARYPWEAGRIPKLVWRGSTTDSKIYPLSAPTIAQLPRVQLHLMGRWHSRWLDTQLVDVVQFEGDATAVKGFLGLAQRIAMEDYNKYMGIVDLDGNGWSDRFAALVMFNTPIVKQVSNISGWFDHLFAPGSAVFPVGRRLEGLLHTAKAFASGDSLSTLKHAHALARNAQGIAHRILHHTGIAEAMAYTVSKYAEKITWKVEADPANYDLIPRSKCCRFTTMPKEAIGRIQAT